MDITNKIEVTHSSISDTKNAFIIDYEKLSSATKEYELEVNLYDNGTLKSINTSASDKTGEIITSVAKTAALLALINTTGTAGVAVAVAGTQKAGKQPVCDTSIIAAISSKKTAVKAVKDADKIVADKLEELKKLKALVKDKAGIEKPNPAYEKALKALALSHEDATIKRNELDAINKKLTITTKYTVHGLDDQTLKVKPEVLIKSGWVKKDVYIDADVKGAELLKLYFSVEGEDTSANNKKAIENATSGIVYQQGETVKLKVCSDQPCVTSKPHFDKNIFATDAGRLARLPFSNGAFEENGFEAKFNEKGTLQYVKFSSSSTGEKAAGTLADVAEVYGDYKTKRKAYSDAELAKVDTKEIADLDHQIEILTKTKELKALNKEADEDLAKLKRELELKQLLHSIKELEPDEAAEELARLKIVLEIQQLLAGE